MSVLVNSPRIPVPKRAKPKVARMGRKIALCGSHSSSLAEAPWGDPSWEFWGHGSSYMFYGQPMDVYFDLHVKACWTRESKMDKRYPEWLAKNLVPIYMQDHFADVPASLKYPRRQVLTEFSYAHQRHYFTNQTAWMIALALTEPHPVSQIGIFGVNYGTETEYARQRGCAEYWIGQCDARGIAVHLPPSCSLLRDPASLYGYESHDAKTGLLKDEWKRKEFNTIVPVLPEERWERVAPPTELAEVIAEEEKMRPDWTLKPSGKGNGEARKE